MTTWKVTYGVREEKATAIYYTAHHAEQFARALRLNGTPVTVEEVPEDLGACFERNIARIIMGGR